MSKNHQKKMKYSNRFINLLVLTAIIVLSLLVRLYKIEAPITDKFSREQAEVLMTAKTYGSQSSPFFNDKPFMNNDSDETESTLYNPSRFQLTSYLIAKLSTYYPQISLSIIARTIMIIANLIIITCIFFLTLRLAGRVAAAGATIFAGLFPYFIFHAHIINTILVPLATIHLAIVFLYLSLISRSYKTKSRIYFFISFFLTAFTLLVEPMFFVYLLPIGYLLLRKYGINSLRKIQIYLFMGLSILPSLLFNIYAHTLPQFLPLPIWSNSLGKTNASTDIFFLNKLFLTSLFKDRIINSMLGTFGFGIVFLGIIKKIKKSMLFNVLFVSSLLFLIIFSKENYQYESLQMVFLVPFSFYFGIGFSIFIHQKDDTIQNKFAFPLAVIVIFMSFYFSFLDTLPLYTHNNQMVQVSKIIKVITDQNDLIATDTKDDKSILVLSDRMGIPSTDSGETNLIQNNIKYLVTFNKGYAKTLEKQYKQVFSSSNGYIFQLQ